MSHLNQENYLNVMAFTQVNTLYTLYLSIILLSENETKPLIESLHVWTNTSKQGSGNSVKLMFLCYFLKCHSKKTLRK